MLTRVFRPLASARRLVPAAQHATHRYSHSSSLFAKLLPLEKTSVTEKDVDEWLQALDTLKKGQRAPETEVEVYLVQLGKPQQFLHRPVEATPEQKAEQARYIGQPVPLMADPVVENLTNLVMRDGKKARAQRQVARALYLVYLQTRTDPVQVLYETLDQMGPLFHNKVQKTGTAKNHMVPFPLSQRQRNRYAILWILDGALKKKSLDFSVRLGEEIVAAWQGKSSGYDKKLQLHKNAISQRAYITL